MKKATYSGIMRMTGKGRKAAMKYAKGSMTHKGMGRAPKSTQSYHPHHKKMPNNPLY